MEIYLDVVILENIVVNYLILLVTAKFSKNMAGTLRLFLGSLVGAAYLAFIILLPGMKMYTTVLSKFLLSVAMVAVTFNVRKVLPFLKTLALFYAATFMFAGAGFALMFFNREWAVVRNGVVVTPFSFLKTTWSELLLALAVALIIIRIIWDAAQSRFTREKLLVRLNIVFERRNIGLDALVDTGNSLHDPLTNMPVVVVEYSAIKELLPESIRNIFEKDCESDLDTITAAISVSGWLSRFRLIPFTSLGRENGMLIGFRPDYIEIGNENERRGVNDVIVGIYNRALTKNRQYAALVNPELV